MLIKIEYHEHACYQNKSEWLKVINESLRRINSTYVGKILINKINEKIIQGNNVTISNYSPTKNFQYPHFNIFNNSIVIPDTPYFIEVEVFNETLIKGTKSDIFDKIINCYPLNIKLDNDFCFSFGVFKFQPVFVTLFHELVHCLRHLNSFEINSKIEEESTIYGIVGNTLVINDIKVTENTFRKELGLGYRISHNSRDIYVYNSTQDKGKFSKEYLKSLFLKDNF